MEELNNVYDIIDEAESFLRNNKLRRAVQEYERAVKQLGNINELEGLPDNIHQAISLLQDDTQQRVKELTVLQEAQSGSETSESGSNSSLSRLVADGSFYHNGNSMLLVDPLLLSITAKLENNILRIMEASDNKKANKNEVAQQFAQFRKELSVYEQKKSKDYDIKLEQIMKENKKLLNQVHRLKDRWDSLVESAKQKRNQQQG